MSTPADRSRPRYLFADLTLDVAARRVTREGRSLELSALNFDLLRVLVEAAPNVVTYDDLAEKVWGRHFVSPENVAQRIMLLRQGLSDDASRPRYVEAVRSRGYRLIPIVETVSARDSPPTQRRAPGIGRVIAYALTGLLVVVIGWLVYRIEPSSTAATPAPAVDVLPKSVAVLPLDNLSADPDKAYIASGLHVEILNQLTNLGDLNVILLPSVLQYAENRPPLAEIARTLRVESVLEGSVRYAGDRVRVTMRLSDPRTGRQLWAQTYDPEPDDPFATESDIARNVARALEAELSSDEENRLLQGVSTKSREAYELYLAALGFSARAAGFAAALERFDRALTIDPMFVEAWIAKAQLHNIGQGFVAPGADREQQAALDAASRAIAIDPGSWRAHSVLSFVSGNQGDWLRAEAEFRQAVDLGMPVSQRAETSLLRNVVGDFAGARDVLQSSLQVNPMNSNGAAFLLAAHEMAGDSAARRAGYERGEALYGDWLGDAIELLLRLGDRDEEFLRRQDFTVNRAFVFGPTRFVHQIGQHHLDAPEAGLETLRALDADEAYASAGALTYMAAWSAYFGDPELALRQMGDAIAQQPSRVWYLWLPVFSDVRRQPGFKNLIRDLDLVDYWRDYGWPDNCRAAGDSDFECH